MISNFTSKFLLIPIVAYLSACGLMKKSDDDEIRNPDPDSLSFPSPAPPIATQDGPLNSSSNENSGWRKLVNSDDNVWLRSPRFIVKKEFRMTELEAGHLGKAPNFGIGYSHGAFFYKGEVVYNTQTIGAQEPYCFIVTTQTQADPAYQTVSVTNGATSLFFFRDLVIASGSAHISGGAPQVDRNRTAYYESVSAESKTWRGNIGCAIMQDGIVQEKMVSDAKPALAKIIPTAILSTFGDYVTVELKDAGKK